VVQKVRENAYKIELSGDMQISTTFNVENLAPYLKVNKDHDEDMRTIPL